MRLGLVAAVSETEVLLQVEKRGENQYFVSFQGEEFRLASPIHLDYESRLEWRCWLHKFSFSAIRLEDE